MSQFYQYRLSDSALQRLQWIDAFVSWAFYGKSLDEAGSMILCEHKPPPQSHTQTHRLYSWCTAKLVPIDCNFSNLCPKIMILNAFCSFYVELQNTYKITISGHKLDKLQSIQVSKIYKAGTSYSRCFLDSKG